MAKMAVESRLEYEDCLTAEDALQNFQKLLTNDTEGSALDGVKKLLDEEFLESDHDKLRYWLGDYLPKDKTFARPSDIISFIENNMPPDDVMNALEHVFGIMDYHTEYSSKGFKDIITAFRKEKQTFGCQNVIGREDEVRMLLKLLNQEQCRGVWIHGLGGLGKTMLAHEVSYRLRRKYTCVNIVLKRVTRPTELIRAILTKMGVQIAATDYETLLQQLVFHLKHVQGKTCLVLDNIEDAYQKHQQKVVEIIQKCLSISTLTHTKWIFTSRLAMTETRLDGLEQRELGPLSTENARTLLNVCMKPLKLDDSQCLELLELTNNIPLAIRLLSVSVKDKYPHSCKLGRVKIDSVRDTLTGKLQRAPAMKDCIEFAFSSLNEESRLFLLMLSVVETAEFDTGIVKAILEIPDDTGALFHMMVLTNRQIVQRVNMRADETICDTLKYCFHPLIAVFLQEKRSNVLKIQQANFLNAKARFCRCVQERFEPYLDQIDTNFLQADKFISDNGAVLKIFLQIVSREITITNEFAVDLRNRYLSRLQEAMHMTHAEKQKLYERIIYRVEKDRYSSLFWKIEEVQNLIDVNDFSSAKVRLDAMEQKFTFLTDEQNEMPRNETEIYLCGRYFFVRGRYFRRKEHKEPSTAISYFKRALGNFEGSIYISDRAMVLDALGNAYFDQEDYNTSLEYHEKSMHTLLDEIGGNMHPYVALYEFNVGTVYLAKAQIEFSKDRTVTQAARENYQKALDIFNASMKNDERMGTNGLIQYSEKLRQRAIALFRLDDWDSAINDLKDSLQIKTELFQENVNNAVSSNYKTGLDFIRWRKEVDVGTDISRKLLIEAVTCFQKAEELIEETEEGRQQPVLTGSEKDNFISDYRKLADAGLPKARRTEILQFCEWYQTDSSESSDSNSSSPKQTSSPEDDDDMQEASETKGIPFAEREKEEQIRFGREFELRLEAASRPERKRRRSSSLSSDDE